MAVDAQELDSAALADRLALAVSERRPIPTLTSQEPRLDVAQAYRVQRVGIDRRVESGEVVIGYKLGLVSRAKQEAMGVAEPLWGWLTNAMVHDEDQLLDLGSLIHPRVESEIAFLLDRDVPAGNATVPSVLAATVGILPALEVLDSRYENFSFTLPDVVADNASAARILFGGKLVPTSEVDLQREGMVLRENGEVVYTAAGAAIAGHPAAAVAWLARAAGGLPAGSVILSGGLTAPIELRPGSVVTAEFTTLGAVTLLCGT